MPVQEQVTRRRHLCLLWKEGLVAKWVEAIWSAYGIFATIKGEMNPSTQDQLSVAAMIEAIPPISLAWWVAGFLAIGCLWFFESSFRIQHKSHAEAGELRGRIEALEDTLKPKNVIFCPVCDLELTLKRAAMTDIPKAAIEAAEKAVEECFGDRVYDPRYIARAALTAALPHLTDWNRVIRC